MFASLPCIDQLLALEKLMRAADHLIKTLKTLGTKYIFSLSGNQIMPIYDALIDSDIELIHVRHEGAAVHMADAWGRLTGTPGVALIAAGPGFANSLSATFVAKMAESPIVVLSGHTALATLGQGDFQEMPQPEMAAPVSKASWLVKDKNRLGHDIEKAFAIAKHGRPGPVHLALPPDMLSAEVDTALVQTFSAADGPSLKSIEPSAIDQITKTIKQAERPLLLAGAALMRLEAFRHAQEKCNELDLPLIGMESPRGVFDPSLGTLASTLKQADLLVLFGKKLDFTLKMGQEPFIKKGTRVIQIDVDLDVLELTKHNGKALEIIGLVQADPMSALTQLIDVLSSLEIGKDAWSAEVSKSLAYAPPAWDKLHSENGEPMHSAEVGRAIQGYLAGAEDSIFISDGGEFCQWMQAFVRPPHRVINGLSGSIGIAIPLAIAARLAFPKSRIVACIGDGGFGFLPFEYDTAVRHNIPFIGVVGNDARWNAEYQIQLRNYGEDRLIGVDLLATEYHTVVQTLGGWGKWVTDVDALQETLIAAGESNLPACINAAIRGEVAPKLG